MLSSGSYFLAAFLTLAHLARCAAAILARLFADIFRRFRLGLPPPYTPANAVKAALSPDNCFSTRSRSFFNCFIMEDRLRLRPPRDGIVAAVCTLFF
jgi:hypothetical protein